MRAFKSWRWVVRKRHILFDGGTCGVKMKQLPFMLIVCTVMLFIVYRTTNYQYRQTEIDERLNPFYTSKDIGVAYNSLASLPRGIIQAGSDLELKPLWSTSSSREKVDVSSSHNLLAIPVGIKQKSNVDVIVQKFLSKNFTIILFHYDGNMDGWWDLPWSKNATHIVAQNQSKWSATVDSDLFSRYFGRCPVITAQGRTHPVSTHFLEDIYESINYLLALDSSTYLRDDTSTKKNDPVSNHRGKKNLVLSGWGDESILSEDFINPYYIPSTYQTYSDQTRKNLRRLNEDVIDYDLLEDLVHYIDETHPKGAILVFLPGVSEIHTLFDKLAASYQFGGRSSGGRSSEWIN